MSFGKKSSTIRLNQIQFTEDLASPSEKYEYLVNGEVRVIGKFQNYFIYSWNKIIKEVLIITAFVKFEYSLKVKPKMKNLLKQLMMKLNGYTKVGFFFVKRNQIMYRVCQKLTIKMDQDYLEQLIFNIQMLIKAIITKYYIQFYLYLFDMPLSQHLFMLGKQNQAEFIQTLEYQINIMLSDGSQFNQETTESQFKGYPNIQPIYVHGDKCLLDNREFSAKFNFFNSQSDIYESQLEQIWKDITFLDVLEKMNSPFLETIYTYLDKEYRDKNTRILSLHKLILDNKSLSLFRRFQILQNVCEGIRSFQYQQQHDSKSTTQQINKHNEIVQIQILNPLRIMITPQITSYLLLWPYKNEDQRDLLKYQYFQFKEKNDYVKYNKLEKHTIYSIGKLVQFLFQNEFQPEGPTLIIESINKLIKLCLTNQNITIQYVVNILNLLQKYLEQFD